LLQFLLMLPVPMQFYSALLYPEPAPTNAIKHIIKKVMQERPASTLLLLNSRHNDKCAWEDLLDLYIPIIHLDDLGVFQLKDSFSSNIIAVAAMSELADVKLLPVLAKVLHRIRDVRVIIWLQNIQTDLDAFLDMIGHHANKANYLNLLVINSNAHNDNGSIASYRLHPFPSPKLLRITDIGKDRIFPIFWRNYHNKTAVVVPSLYPPSSYLHTDKKTGKNYLNGFMDTLIMEFAKKFNISLQMQRSLQRTDYVHDRDIVAMTLSGEIDLSMHGRFWRPDLEASIAVGNSNLFVVVPCGDIMGLDNIYHSLKSYFLIVLCVYLMFSVIETLLAAATCRIFGRRYRFRWASLFVNMNSFSWVLGLPINVSRNRRSTSLHQIIMVMSIFSLIITCYFNANLSTLFTNRPPDHHITNFDELLASKLPIVFDNAFHQVDSVDLKQKEFNLHEEKALFVSTHERLQLIFSQNSSYAYQISSKLWDCFDKYQKYYKRKTLCKHKELTIYEDTSLHVLLKNNSIYRKALNDYIGWSHDFGLLQHWIEKSIETLMDFSKRGKLSWHPTPLSIVDLQWVWKLIGIGYSLAILVFIAELCI
ncbi:hypothetical protein KR093_011133, partial [Drosophila rubida]